MEFSVADLQSDITFKTSRSGGKGGQNVNKVSSKAELNYNFNNSTLFSIDEKKRIREKLKNRIIKNDYIQIICEEDRSQLNNKNKCLQKLLMLLKKALYVEKVRKSTKPKRTAVENRLKEKQYLALKKLNRKKDFTD